MATKFLLPADAGFSGNAGKALAVNTGEDALEFVDATLLQYGYDAGSPTDIQITGGSVVGNPALGTLINATAHGFVTGDVLYSTSTANTFAKAQADAEATLGAFICQKIDDDNFRAVQGGSLELSGLTAGDYYYLSDATAGAMTATAPTTTGNYTLCLGVAISTTTFCSIPYPAQEIA